MIKVNTVEAKTTSRKRTIKVSNVMIIDNKLVDIETGESNVLEQIAEAIPEGYDSISFNLSFEISDDE